MILCVAFAKLQISTKGRHPENRAGNTRLNPVLQTKQILQVQNNKHQKNVEISLKTVLIFSLLPS